MLSHFFCSFVRVLLCLWFLRSSTKVSNSCTQVFILRFYLGLDKSVSSIFSVSLEDSGISVFSSFIIFSSFSFKTFRNSLIEDGFGCSCTMLAIWLASSSSLICSSCSLLMASFYIGLFVPSSSTIFLSTSPITEIDALSSFLLIFLMTKGPIKILP